MNTTAKNILSNEPAVKLIDASKLTTAENYTEKDDYILVLAKDHFGLDELDPKFVVPVFKALTKHRAALNKDYVPNPAILETALKLLIQPHSSLGLCLMGESGSGKTEMAMYISHMLNWPLTIKQFNSNIRADELEGERSLIDGNTGFVYSDLLEGFRNGHIILLDEIDKIDPDTAAKLHMPLERKPWSIGANGGEVVSPHKFTRFIGTANTNMSGGDRRYVSSQRQDAAFIKRFLILKMKKPTEVTFAKVLSKHFPELQMGVIGMFVGVAMAINASGNDEAIMDMRQLVSWVRTSLTLSNMPLVDTFDIAFASSLPEHVSDIAMEAIDQKLADKKHDSLGKFISKKS